jgi:hypothetical protein
VREVELTCSQSFDMEYTLDLFMMLSFVLYEDLIQFINSI